MEFVFDRYYGGNFDSPRKNKAVIDVFQCECNTIFASPRAM